MKGEEGDEIGLWEKRGKMPILIVRKNIITSYAVEYLQREERIHEGCGKKKRG